MMNAKNIVMLTALVGALTTSVTALAEPMPPAGTTVNTIPLTTVETNVKSSSGQMMPSMGSSMPSGSMNSGMNNNMGTPMTSDMNMSDSSAAPGASERMPDTMSQPANP